MLVIEDDEDTRANLRDILELDDWRVETAGSVAEVFARRHWSEIALVILDRRLPDGNAEQVLPRLKALAPDAAVIVATGYADLEGAIAALRHGAADYILKPINPEALRASVSRIVEARRLAEALRKEKEFVESLLAQAQAIVLVLDPDGRIVRFNPYLEQISGFPLAEVLGRDWFTMFLPKRDRERARRLFGETLAGAEIIGATQPIVRRDRRRRLIEWSNKTLKDAAGNVTGVLAVGHDVTVVHEARQKALHAERLAAIGQMITGLTHESRNALQRSKACLEMLALEVEDRPQALEMVARIEKAQQHLQRLFEEVRTYAAPINLDREPCGLDQLWRETWSYLAHARKEKNVELRQCVDGVDPVCDIDHFAVGQVFRNIFENALAVVPNPGEIVVRATAALLEGRPAVSVSFRDNGPGLNAEQRERIFEPFYTTKTKGTGLGMAIARRIVQSHGGTIEVGDGPGPGTEIVVTLPREMP
ncbi:MAG TPA: ATP-binding protein [Pirellulales bacterium]|nr:ATP-binding protein [Pirellulales bacterium]